MIVFGPWQSLSEKVRDIVVARDMLDAELLLLDTILQPVEAHVDALRQARGDGPVGQGHCDLVVAQEQGRGLGVAEVEEDEALVVGDASSSKEGGVLGLLYGGTDYRNGVRMTGERAVDEGKRIGRKTEHRQAGEMVEGARDAAGARAREIGSVGENRQDHIRRTKDNTT